MSMSNPDGDVDDFGMAAPENSMTAFVKAANHVLDTAGKALPQFSMKRCAGIVLLSGGKFGCIVSIEWSAGLLFARNKETGEFSAPVAVRFDSAGVGLSVGGSTKDVVLVLNHFSMEKMIEGDGHMKVGADVGFTIIGGGTVGASVDSSKQGLGSSEYYSFDKGLMASAEITAGGVNCVDEVNEEFYGTKKAAEILANPVPGDAELVKLVKKLNEIAG